MTTSPKMNVFLDEHKIAAMNAQLGEQISADYEKILQKDEQLLVVVTLMGATFFAADLLRKITVPVQMDFVRLASYGSGTKSSGNVRILKDIEAQPRDRHVLVLDEIVDSGRTLDFLKERLIAAGPKSLRIGALLSKPSRREIEVKVDYLGCEVPDKFLIGYGLDFAEKYRNLSGIYSIDT